MSNHLDNTELCKAALPLVEDEEALAHFMAHPGAVESVTQASNKQLQKLEQAQKARQEERAASPSSAMPHTERAKASRAALMDEPFPDWLVFGVLPETGLAAIAGEPGAGKSFIAIELACCLASGSDFFGLKTEQREVTYLALEGGAGMKKRLMAWEAKHGRSYPDALDVQRRQVNLLTAEDKQAVFDLTPAGGVLIIDTMAQATAGKRDENDSKSMGGLIAACNYIAQNKNALVVLVAHVGKDESKGIRGHSSLFGALDAQITVKRGKGEENQRREWSIGKAKDSDDGRRVGFELVTVEVGSTPKGEQVFSCYVTSADLPKAGRPPSDSGGVSIEAAGVALRALKQAMQKEGANMVGKVAWLEEFYAVKGGRGKTMNKAFNRAVAALKNTGQVEELEAGYFSLSFDVAPSSND